MNGAEPNFNGRLRTKAAESASWVDLVKLPNQQMAFIYQRLSTHEQINKSIYSTKAQDALFDLVLPAKLNEHEMVRINGTGAA